MGFRGALAVILDYNKRANRQMQVRSRIIQIREDHLRDNTDNETQRTRSPACACGTAPRLARGGRADASGAVLGTGLGMSLVREIVTLHDGQLDLSSQPGQGTRAVLWLPIAEATDDAEAAVPA